MGIWTSKEKWCIDFGSLLLSLGEDLDREGLQKTPERIAKAWNEMLEGYTLQPESFLEPTFEAEGTGIVCCKGIFFTSVCEHHMLPFYGHASICYHPNERVVGLSKLTRLVDCFAKRLQIQERLVEQVANTLYEAIEPKGVFVHMEAIHFCCKGRGIRRNVNFITEAECGTVTDGMRSLGREIERTNE